MTVSGKEPDIQLSQINKNENVFVFEDGLLPIYRRYKQLTSKRKTLDIDPDKLDKNIGVLKKRCQAFNREINKAM